MVGRDGHIIDIQTEEDRGDWSHLRRASQHVTEVGCSRLVGRFEWFSPGTREVKSHELVGNAVNPYGVECLGHI